MINLDAQLCEKIIKLSATDSKLRISANKETKGKKKGVAINIFYLQENMITTDFIDISSIEKRIFFWTHPKNYETENGCIDLAKYLQKQEYVIKGETKFLEKRSFQKGEFDIY